MLIDSDAYKDVSNALGRLTSIARGGGIASKVVFVYELSVSRDQYATNFCEFAIVNVLLQGVQASRDNLALRRAGVHQPALCEAQGGQKQQAREDRNQSHADNNTLWERI